MHVLQIEYPVRDFDTWKGTFDRSSYLRQQSDVHRYRVLRPTDDPNYVIIELEFNSPNEAEAFVDAWRNHVRSSSEAVRLLMGEPQTRIVEAVEAKELLTGQSNSS